MSQVNAVPVTVIAGTASSQGLLANSLRQFLQVQNRSNVVVTAKFDSDFIPGANNVQRIDFSRIPDAGAWKVTIAAAETSSLAYDISAGDLQTELEGLSSVGAGNVSVTGSMAAGFAVEFIEAKAELPQGDIGTIEVSANTLTDSTVEQDAVQLIRWSLAPDGGTFTVTYGADTTGALAWDISPEDLKTALNALTSINGGIASVGQDVESLDFTITFGAPLNDQPVDLLVVDASSLTYDAGNQNDKQRIFVAPAPLQGSYKLSVGAPVNDPPVATAAIAFDATAAEIQTALEDVGAGAGNVTVTALGVDGSLVDGYEIEFISAQANIPMAKFQFEEVTLLPDANTFDEPRKDVPEAIALLVEHTQVGQGQQSVTVEVTSLTDGVAPASADTTVTTTVPGNAEPSEGLNLNPMGQDGDTLLYDRVVPLGGLWLKAEADNSPVSILEG